MSAYVYRCYDADDRVIYVGFASNLFNRIEQHRSVSWWFHQVARIRATVHPNGSVARAVERQLIASANPRWNIVGRWSSRFGWTAQDYADYYLAHVMQGNESTAYNQAHLNKVERECRARFGITPRDLAS